MTPPPALSPAATPPGVAEPPITVPLRAAPAFRGTAVWALRWIFADGVERRRRGLMDLLVLTIAAAAALLAAPPVRAVPAFRVLDAAFPLIAWALLQMRPAPDDRLGGSMLDPVLHILGILSIASMMTVALGTVFDAPRSVGLCLRLWIFSTVYLGTARAAALWVRRDARAAGILGTPTLIVGAGVVATHVARRLATSPAYGLRPVGLLDADPLPSVGAADRPPVLGGAEDLAAAIERTGARQVILAFSSEPDSVLIRLVRECHRLGVQVALVPRMFETVNERARLDHLGGVPILSLAATNPRSWQFAVKHLLDRCVAFAALLLVGPLMIALAIAVRLSSPGPVLFRQRRVGRDGQEFDLLKFRSMRPPAGGDAFALTLGSAPGGVEGVDRRTPIGRLLRASSLDELPQLLNVLRGEMSLVGPRPERPEYVARFTEDVNRYGERHRVKAGITGWAQVAGLRGQTSISDRVEWDNFYIENWSLRLDLKIMALTVAELLRFRDS